MDGTRTDPTTSGKIFARFFAKKREGKTTSKDNAANIHVYYTSTRKRIFDHGAISRIMKQRRALYWKVSTTLVVDKKKCRLACYITIAIITTIAIIVRHGDLYYLKSKLLFDSKAIFKQLRFLYCIYDKTLAIFYTIIEIINTYKN